VSVYVFAGPTIAKSDITKCLDAVVLPPVAMGDLYQIATLQPQAIGIIDGYFDGRPSVWHKEILWAMAQGIPVFGASSMGALRAAELHTFGMRGIGRIFEAFADGTLEDDDEVAMHHGPAETGYITLSEPMVNIRATLDKALKQNIVTPDTEASLTALAKNQYYPQRSWKRLLTLAQENGIAHGQINPLNTWLEEHRVDQKRDDAMAMLEAISSHLASQLNTSQLNSGAQPHVAGFHLEWTVMWDKIVRTSTTKGNTTDFDCMIADELRLDPGRFKPVQRRALARLLAERGNGRDQDATDPVELDQAITQFRRENGFFMKRQLDQWLATNDLDKDSLDRLISSELRLAQITRSSGAALDSYILAELRLTGDYAELAARGRRKAEILEGLEKKELQAADAGLNALALRAWFFETRFQCQVPDDLDSFLQDAGYPDRDDFDRMLDRENIFGQESEPDSEKPGIA
jgi:hypothetical protein